MTHLVDYTTNMTGNKENLIVHSTNMMGTNDIFNCSLEKYDGG